MVLPCQVASSPRFPADRHGNPIPCLKRLSAQPKGLLDLAEEHAFGSLAFTALLGEDGFGEQNFAAGFEALEAALSAVIQRRGFLRNK